MKTVFLFTDDLQWKHCISGSNQICTGYRQHNTNVLLYVLTALPQGSHANIRQMKEFDWPFGQHWSPASE
jgi:hypothetical protein